MSKEIQYGHKITDTINSEITIYKTTNFQKNKQLNFLSNENT